MSTEKKRRRLLWLVIASPIILFLLLAYAAMPGKSTYTVSPETTVATEHVDAEGFVDNIVALNTRLRGDITPEQNANVLIWKALGPHPEGGTMPEEYFQWLGHASPPEEGEYLIGWTKFLREREGVAQGELPPDFEPQNKRRERTLKWMWKPEDEPDVAAWLAKNARPIAFLEEASKRPAYYNPLVPKKNPTGGNGSLISCLLPNVQVCREGANLLACRAMLHLGAGRVNEAWNDLMSCHRLGRVMERGGCLIEYLVGVAIQQIAIQGETVFLSQAKLTTPQLAACRADLQKLPSHARIADKVDLTERFCMLDILQSMARNGSDILKQIAGSGEGIPEPAVGRLFSRSTDWNPAMRLANGWYDRWVAALRLEDIQARELKVRELEAELKAMAAETKVQAWTAPILGPKQRGELFGKLTIGLMMPALEKMVAVEVRMIQIDRNLSIAFALAEYRANTGKYPAALAELMPKYLTEIPKDVYTDGDLKYQVTPAGYLLHSVGPNRIDDQGRNRESQPPGDDWAIEMPAKEPPPVEEPVGPPIPPPLPGQQE
ncbi:hypothetical protein [Zavarzinella formosa]|uniref:hypothetical protein n=1 Tax=Zavarzinella formosa TaxID=360055 RepID=UPI0002DB9A31|nr:hypothetical protein [Zavarzinella formosa]